VNSISDLGLRGLSIVAAFVLGFAAIAFIAAESRADEYTATASLVFRAHTFGETLLGDSVPPTRTPPTPEGAERAIRSAAIAAAAGQSLPGGESAAQIAGKVEVEGNPNSEVITISATDHDPERAAAVADAYAEAAVDSYRSNARGRVAKEIEALQGSGAGGGEADPATRAEVAHLRALETLQIGELEVVRAAATPTDPSSPASLIVVLLGALVGLGVGAAAATLDAGRRPIGSVRALERSLGIAVIGAFPDLGTAADADQDGTVKLPPRLVDLLVARIHWYDPERQTRTVWVTSAGDDEGRKTLANNLGADVARSADAADAVLVVARLGRVTARQARALGGRLRAAETPVVGAVANFAPGDDAFAAALIDGPARDLELGATA
jgi:polysaccharide biosynthesis transport protein